MSGIHEDIFTALKSFFETTLNCKVELGFPDDRLETQANRVYPCVSITFIMPVWDPDNRYSGMVEYGTAAQDNKTAIMKRAPIPVQMHFHLETFCATQVSEWPLSEKIIAVLYSQKKIVTGDGRVLYLQPQGTDNLDSIDAGLWRKGYHFSVVVWFDHPNDAYQVFLVLQTLITGAPVERITV